VDEHLLGCDSCWQAVRADRAARAALGKVRVAAPEGLADRVSLAVGLASSPSTGLGQVRPLAKRRERTRVLAAGGALVVAMTGLASWLALPGGGAAEPAQVAAVVTMLTRGSSSSKALEEGVHLTVAHQALTVRAYEVHGKEAIVATSGRPFPLPRRAHLLARSKSMVWMAAKGSVSMYGVNRPKGRSRCCSSR
jgi:hypothetical protein